MEASDQPVVLFGCGRGCECCQTTVKTQVRRGRGRCRYRIGIELRGRRLGWVALNTGAGNPLLGRYCSTLR